MATTREQQVQRGYHYAIVDEVDSILIDEARTPLIISGPATISTHQYDKWKPLVEQLVRKQTMLCNRIASEAKEKFDAGKLEEGGLPIFKVKLGQPRNKQLLRMMEDPEKRKAIDKAELSFYQDTRKDELFALKEELFFTIDEKSQEADLSEQGRSFMNPDDPNAFVLPDLISEFTEIDLNHSLSHEEKEKQKGEKQANEFHDIHKLDVLVIPTNRPVARKDSNDRIYKTRREKYNAVINEIKECHAKTQPVLVGTMSVEASELLSRMLKREKIPHNVLNAKYHMQEAEIVARAGQPGTVTISTNMAGRGTDIKLGPGVTERGGLYVIGTERHESRRIDRQLRGRCARQGDPGASRFYVSFEDDLMRNFGAADRMTKIMERFGLDEGQELQHPWRNKSV